MKCDDIQLMVSTYIDDALDVNSQATMFAHLATCSVCREFLRRSLELRTGLASLQQPGVPPSLDRKVMRLYPLRGRRWQGAGKRMRALWSHRLSVPLPSAALIALALITVTVLSISLWANPEVVSVPCLPAVDVYATPPAHQTTGN